MKRFETLALTASSALNLGIWLSLSSCAPPTNPHPINAQVVNHNSAPESEQGTENSHNAPSTQEIDRSTCGLPLSLQKPDWPRILAPTQQHDPVPPSPGDITIAVLPDTQYYTSCRERHMSAQTRYVAALAQRHPLAATLFLGDLTENNTKDEWRFVQDALDLLPQNVPTLLATGNHDYGQNGSADQRTTLFNELLKPPNAVTQASVLAQMEPKHWENVLYRIKLGQRQLAVLVLEWSPRTKVVDWAKTVLAQFPGERLIFVTHAYMYFDDTRYNWQQYGQLQEWNPIAYGTAKLDPSAPPTEENRHPEGAWDGEMLWQELLSNYPGLFLTLSGHVLGDGTGYLKSHGSAGNVVHQVLANYQMLNEGGLGYLRLLDFKADGTQLIMKTYSPSLDLYATASDQLLSLDIEPPL